MIHPSNIRGVASCGYTPHDATCCKPVVCPDSVLEWDSYGITHNDHDLDSSVLLEGRGITAQKPGVSKNETPKVRQQELWRSGTIHKICVASKLRQQGLTDFADKLDSCHTEWTVAQCGNCKAVRKFANRCDLFCCPECAYALQKHRQHQVEWWIKTITQPKHVVLTVRNLPDLSAGHLRQFKKFWAQLRRRKFARNWKGGFYRIELTNEGRGWHLHLHALVDAKWIDQTELTNQWRSITNGLGYIVKVKDVRAGSYLREVTKYVVKGNELAKWSPTDIATFVRAFDGARTFGVFGSLYGMRTKFSAYVASLRKQKAQCACGANCMAYWTEAEWLARPVPVIVQQRSQPPPPQQHQLHIFVQPIRWPD